VDTSDREVSKYGNFRLNFMQVWNLQTERFASMELKTELFASVELKTDRFASVDTLD
jgi:hypothetical protein